MNRRIERVIFHWKGDAGLQEPVMYDVNYDTKEILIYSTRPGWLIGRKGELVYKYEDFMRAVWPGFKGFKFKETQGWIY